MIRPERVVLRRLRRLLRPPVAMRLHVGRSDEGDPADDLSLVFEFEPPRNATLHVSITHQASGVLPRNLISVG